MLKSGIFNVLRLLAFLSVIIFSHVSYGQMFQGAVIAGFNLSKVAGDEVNGFYDFRRIGLNIGAAVIIPFKQHWDVTLETIYSQKGAFQKETPTNDKYPWKYNLRLNYVEVPVLIHYVDRDIITAGLGFSWGRLVHAEEIEDGGNKPAYQDTIPFNNNDYSLLGDLRFRLWKRLHLNIRIAHSIIKIRKREFRTIITNQPWTNNQYNFVFSLRLVYIFNEKLQNVVKNK